MFSTRATHKAPATVEALRVFDFDYDDNDPNPNKGKLTKTPVERDRYLLLAAAASMALDLLHSPAGYSALQQCAFVTLKDTQPELRAGRKPKRYKHYTEKFLKSIRLNFPVVVIRNLDAMNARTKKHEWHTHDTKDYVSVYAGVVEINKLLLERAFRARYAYLDAEQKMMQTRDLSRLTQLKERLREARHSLFSQILRLGITLAHEICHVQTSYLLHRPTAETPPRAGYGSNYVLDTRGEAGRYWEYLTFGGYIDMSGQTDSSHRVIVAIRAGNEDRVWNILPLAVWKLVQERDFSCLPLVDDGDFDEEYISKTHAWKWSKNVNIFEGKRRIGLDGRTVPPFEIPEPKRFWLTSPHNSTAYLISGPHIQDWLCNEPSDPEKGFEGAALRTVVTVAT